MFSLNDKYVVKSFELPNVISGSSNCRALKRNLFISYNHTIEIANYAQEEYWGVGSKNLFSYLDYIFRARVIDNEIKVFKFRKSEIAIFNTALKNKQNKFFYLVMTKNDNKETHQDWILKGKVEEYCLTKEEIMKKYEIEHTDIPEFRCFISENNFSEKKIKVNWFKVIESCLRPNKSGKTRKLIMKELKKNGIKVPSGKIVEELSLPFFSAVSDSINSYKNDKSSILSGLFFSDNNYRQIFQILLNVVYQGKTTKFSAMLEFESNKYVFKKIINIDMARRNSRLISALPKIWCVPNIEKIQKIEKTKKEYFSDSDNTSLKSGSSKSYSTGKNSESESENFEQIPNVTVGSFRCEKQNGKVHKLGIDQEQQIYEKIIEFDEFEHKNILNIHPIIHVHKIFLTNTFHDKIIQTINTKISDENNNILFENVKSYKIFYDHLKAKLTKNEIHF